MAVVVVNEAELGIVKLAGPLDGLGDITVCCDFAVGGIGISGADVTSGAVEFADILRQVPAVGVPGGIFLDGQRAGGYRLGRIPADEPESRVRGTGEVDTGDLQVAAVEVALMQCYVTLTLTCFVARRPM